jgi:hypothetical protein
VQFLTFDILTNKMKSVKYSKAQVVKHVMLSANPCLFRHQGAIFRECNTSWSLWWCSLRVGLVRSESLDVLFHRCSMQNAYNAKPSDDAGDCGDAVGEVHDDQL